MLRCCSVVGVGYLSQLAEEIRDAVDSEGAKDCFRQSVLAFAKETGLPEQGLWMAVDAVINRYNPEKVLKRLHKSWGGDPKEWARFYALALKKPDC